MVIGRSLLNRASEIIRHKGDQRNEVTVCFFNTAAKLE